MLRYLFPCPGYRQRRPFPQVHSAKPFQVLNSQVFSSIAARKIGPPAASAPRSRPGVVAPPKAKCKKFAKLLKIREQMRISVRT